MYLKDFGVTPMTVFLPDLSSETNADPTTERKSSEEHREVGMQGYVKVSNSDILLIQTLCS
jgi:hypothetical protein